MVFVGLFVGFSGFPMASQHFIGVVVAHELPHRSFLVSRCFSTLRDLFEHAQYKIYGYVAIHDANLSEALK